MTGENEHWRRQQRVLAPPKKDRLNYLDGEWGDFQDEGRQGHAGQSVRL